MRKDMGKIALTAPRRDDGSNEDKYNKLTCPKEKRYFKDVEIDLRPKHESMKRRHIINYGGKRLSDYLTPLQRYLQKNAGRKWNDVWSEICSTLSGNGMQAQHIKDHVKGFVSGIDHSNCTNFLNIFGEEFYVGSWVDKDGILQYKEKKPRKYPRKIYNYLRESDTVEYHKINGCWYRIEMYAIVDMYGIHKSVEKKKAINKRNAKRMNLDSATSLIEPKWKG